jgi:hypothetical protein
VLWVAFTLAMRAKYPPLLTGIRKMNRAATNPRQMGTAGQPGAYASIVRHVGRNSGTPYETPVQALPTDDGFVIPLPHSDTADWMKNVLAAGTAIIVNEGADHTVDRPEIVPTSRRWPTFRVSTSGAFVCTESTRSSRSGWRRISQPLDRPRRAISTTRRGRYRACPARARAGSLGRR